MPNNEQRKQSTGSSKTRRSASKDVVTLFTMKGDPSKALAGFTLPDDSEVAIVSSKPESVRQLKKTFGSRAARVAEVVERSSASGQAKTKMPAVDKTAFEPDARSQALLEGVRIAQEDLREAGGAYDLEEVRTLMRGISRQAIDKRVKEGSLLAVPGPSNRRSYPTVQFMRDGSVVPGLKSVQQALQMTNPWMVLNFLIHPDDRLNGKKPIDLLRNGHVDLVVEAARRHGEQGV
ncbi:hypothetical protein [Fodinicurvata sediminis]|uniref:hypothetical protein n=1 Tax=Fodinicurvata sediminis TaxID=1121832 RepID=UPI0003B2F7B7|nr:hypothetical protein [Fodinicurvata sediminis]